jgi:hypothetical protein
LGDYLQGKLTINGQEPFTHTVIVRLVPFGNGSGAVTNRPVNWKELTPKTFRKNNIFFNHHLLKRLTKPHPSSIHPYVADYDYEGKQGGQGPRETLRSIMLLAGKHIIGKGIPGGYWIDATGEAEINGKTAAQIIEEENRKVAAAEEQRRKEAEAAEAKRRKEAEKKAAEEQRKVLQQKKQQAKYFLDEWDEIYSTYGAYETEVKKLRTVSYVRNNRQIIAVTNAPDYVDIDKNNHDARYITRTQNEGQYKHSSYLNQSPSYTQSLKKAITSALISKKPPRDTTSHYWVDETGEAYSVLEIYFVSQSRGLKESRNGGEQSRASMSGLGYLMEQAFW